MVLAMVLCPFRIVPGHSCFLSGDLLVGHVQVFEKCTGISLPDVSLVGRWTSMSWQDIGVFPCRGVRALTSGHERCPQLYHQG